MRLAPCKSPLGSPALMKMRGFSRSGRIATEDRVIDLSQLGGKRRCHERPHFTKVAKVGQSRFRLGQRHTISGGLAAADVRPAGRGCLALKELTKPQDATNPAGGRELNQRQRPATKKGRVAAAERTAFPNNS